MEVEKTTPLCPECNKPECTELLKDVEDFGPIAFDHGYAQIHTTAAESEFRCWANPYQATVIHELRGELGGFGCKSDEAFVLAIRSLKDGTEQQGYSFLGIHPLCIRDAAEFLALGFADLMYSTPVSTVPPSKRAGADSRVN